MFLIVSTAAFLLDLGGAVKPGSGVQARDAFLHVLETHIGVHGRRGRGRTVPKLVLDLPEIAGFPQQVCRQGVPGRVNRKLPRQAGPLDGPPPDALKPLSRQRSTFAHKQSALVHSRARRYLASISEIRQARQVRWAFRWSTSSLSMARLSGPFFRRFFARVTDREPRLRSTS